MNPGSSNGERGAALVHALALVFLVIALSVAMLQRSLAMSRDTMRERGQLRAAHAAVGGLAKARHALRHDPSFRGATLRIGGCEVRVEVRPKQDPGLEITSQATCYPAGANGPRVRVQRVETIRR